MPSLSQPHEKARPGRARLGTVSAREAGVAMFANKTRILLTFREDVLGRARVFPGLKLARSEEHTSELQSRSDLVCRLLLEKKKKKQPTTAPHSRSQRAYRMHSTTSKLTIH